jgi:hypothetical protein
MEFQPFDVDANLMTLNELKDEKTRRKCRRNRNKERAEAQFDTTARPIKLEVFFKDMLECTPDVPDTSVELDGNEEFAPMIMEPNIYPSNALDLSVEILDTANDIIEMEKPEVLDLQTNSQQAIDLINSEMKKLKTASLITGVDQQHVSIRNSAPILTAKRFSIKSLQLFSFSEHYSKHFTYDRVKLRELNTDMLIDETDESRNWLNMLGRKYQKVYLDEVSPFEEPPSDEYLLRHLQPGNKFFRALGYATILKQLGPNSLANIDQPLSMLNPFILETAFYNISVHVVLDYFGIKMFGHDPLLNFQLNYLHLIPYYLKVNRKQKIFSIFEYLDKKGNFFNK